VPIFAPGFNWCLCLIPLLLLLLIPLLFFSSSTAAPPIPPTTTLPPTGPTKPCTIFGDPHVFTFDGSHEDYYTPGEYWIVRSDTVKIQGFYSALPMTNGLAVLKALAISGPFIKGNKLILQSMDKGSGIVLYNGQPVLPSFPMSWKSPDGLISIDYNNVGGTIQYGRNQNNMHVLHVHMPDATYIQVNQWNEAGEGAYMNARITMRAQPNQDGHCGNFNGNIADDARVQVRARVSRTGVPANELIFPWPKTPVNPGNHPDVNDCPQGKLPVAKNICKAKEHNFFPSRQCLMDVCFTGHQM